MNTNEVVRLALDYRNGEVQGNYTKAQTSETLRQALIEANGGKTKLDIRDIRDGNCAELFEIIEQVLDTVKHDVMTTNPLFQRLVDYHNIAFGDAYDFVVPDDEDFVVSEIGSGNQGIRRQRIVGGSTVSVRPTWKAIKIYEEIELILAGRVDFNDAINRVARSFANQVYGDINTVLTGLISNIAAPYKVTGNFSESSMLSLIQHVEANNNANAATIFGTKVALASCVGTTDSSTQTALNDKYLTGVMQYFWGTPKVELKQLHKPGTDTFMFDDDKLWVLASAAKPILYVTEGNSLVLPHNFTENVDMTQEYMLMEKTGIAAYVPAGAGKIGVYDM